MWYKKPEGKHSSSESLRCGDKNTHTYVKKYEISEEESQFLCSLRVFVLKGLGVRSDEQKVCVSAVAWPMHRDCHEHAMDTTPCLLSSSSSSKCSACAVAAQSRIGGGEWLWKKKSAFASGSKKELIRNKYRL